MSSKTLKGHPLHAKTDSELQFIIRDAGEAAKAMRGHDPAAEAKYLDQVNDACTIIYARVTSARRSRAMTARNQSRKA